MSKDRELLDLDHRFLRPEDLRDRKGRWAAWEMTIKRVVPANELKDARKRPIDCQCLEFEQSAKVLALTSKTNKRLLQALHGRDLAGKSVTLYPVMGPSGDGDGMPWFQTPNMLGIRIRIPAGLAVPKIKPEHLGKDLTCQTQENSSG